MIKNLLVQIPSELELRPVTDGAISLASTWGASLDAICIGYETTNVSLAIEGGSAVAAVYEMERERALARAEAAIAVFEAEARNAAIVHGSKALTAIPAEAGDMLSAASRLYDLTIAPQPNFERDSYDNSLAVDVLFGSGGPVLFVPYTNRGPLALKRIGIAWDGSRLAARAVRDAMPLLMAAADITVVSINEDRASTTMASAAALVEHLARHGLSARIERMDADRAEIQPIILSIAADAGLDLIVMGGYGHSRLQERFLGGVTRAMLHSMTVPTLMSH
jgi:nucleotide-binding universal stress UspA family protein